MKRITFNRIMIAVVLIYFPLAVLGETGSYWRALQLLGLLVIAMTIGATEYADAVARVRRSTPEFPDN